METHFIGPRGKYRCIRGSGTTYCWIVERIADNKTHVVGTHMTREDAFRHAKGMAGLHVEPGIAVVEPEERLPDRRGLVEHSRKL